MADNYDVILEGDETEVLDVGVIEVDPMLKEDVWLLGKVLSANQWQSAGKAFPYGDAEAVGVT